jgi:hypothetical protein
VGLLNVGAGCLGVLLAARAFRRPMLDDSVTELERTAQLLAPRAATRAAATRTLESRQ